MTTKPKALLFISVLALCSCEKPQAEAPPPLSIKEQEQRNRAKEAENAAYAAAHNKVVVDKQAPIENRVSGWDTATSILFTEHGHVKTKSQTIYYLLAEDGTHIEVDMGTYSRTKIGSKINGNWEN